GQPHDGLPSQHAGGGQRVYSVKEQNARASFGFDARAFFLKLISIRTPAVELFLDGLLMKATNFTLMMLAVKLKLRVRCPN
ncbi:MAG: hypothetical protein KC964_22815, partial [Candidatus Omnitrophica bacterium]|nr:hypothetical protein [Candidatus Omnitrophota bacterium]